MYRRLFLTVIATTIGALAVAPCPAQDAKGRESIQARIDKRKAAASGELYKQALQARTQAKTDDNVPFVYVLQERCSSWDLAKSGRIQEVSLSYVIVDELLPNGFSDNYYWRKEANLGLFWAFAKEANSDGKYDILVSGDDQTYFLYAGTAEKLDRYPPSP